MYVINIHGLLGDDEGDGEKYFSVADLATELVKAQGFPIILLDISSLGGNAHDEEIMEEMILAAKKPIHTRNSGNIASAATRLFLLGDTKATRVYDPAKGVFLIHNPHLTIENAEASHLKEATDYVKKIETSYVNYYNKKTNVDKVILAALMSKDLPLTFEQVDSMGFATIKHEIKAVANFKHSNKSKTKSMSIEKIEKDMGVIATGVAAIKALLKVKAEFTLNDVNGVVLTFPDIASGDEIAEGVAIMVDGAPATGEYVQADGSTIVAEAGKVTSITPATEDTDAVLKAEIEALKTENAELKASAETAATAHSQQIDEVTAQVEKIDAEFKAVQAQFSKGNPKVQAKTPEAKTTGKGKFKFTSKT